MKKVKNKKDSQDTTNNVRNNTHTDEDAPLVFSFAQFSLKTINLKNEFNNYYKNIEHFSEKLSILLNKALPLLSRETVSIFVSEHSKAKMLHLHKITDKKEIIEKILKEYGFLQDSIDDIFEGEELYQLEVPYANGAMRIVFQRTDNLISFLFVDPNHHIYFNKSKVEQSGSLSYEYCPINERSACERMDYLGTCFAFEYLDEEKFKNSYNYSYEIKVSVK